MTTVTGMTADRMLAIEGASVVDGDVVGDNLILTKHDGTQINAGSVRGAQGVPGPVGQDLSVISAKPVLDVGLANQIRAGRQLSPADFANIGLAAPLGLWNLSDLTDASGNGRNLQNKGAVPFGVGINGNPSTAAQFVGAVGQALYISDTGTNDPFRIRTGSWGCWFRTAKRGTHQSLINKMSAAAGNYAFDTWVETTNFISMGVFFDGNSQIVASGVSDVADDRWHFVVCVCDGTMNRLYVDGIPEISVIYNSVIFSGNGPVNIGARGADASNAGTLQHFGRVDEAFITADVLTDDQIRNLYCARISHTLTSVPIRTSLNVRRLRKGGAFAVSDFPTQPLRLYNFPGGGIGDQGSHNAPLSSVRVGVNMVAGVDGTQNNAYWFNGNNGTDFAATDAGLPSGVATVTYSCWFRTVFVAAGATYVMSYGVSSNEIRPFVETTGTINGLRGPDNIVGPFVRDGLWHFLVMVEDNTAVDGIKRKMYLDGKLVGISTVMPNVTLLGSTGFRIGCYPTGTSPFNGLIDSVFVCDYALTGDQIKAMYAKGSQILAPSPKNAGDHVEAMSATDLLTTFDTLDSQYQVDLAVA